MLVLTWKPGECLRIGDKMTIRVLAIKGNSVRIGIEASQDIAVHHEDVFEGICELLEDTPPGSPPSPVSLRLVRSGR
jgi:carbon storage regulator